ncbi:MAG: M2 family metallopeptidase [Acidobacteriota bacterium]
MMNLQARDWIERHVERVQPLRRSYCLAHWDASISGRAEDYKLAASLEIELRTIHSDADDFDTVRRMRQNDKITDPLIRRQLDLLYLEYLENQIPKELLEPLVRKSREVENVFNTFRARLGDGELTDNQIRDILLHERDSGRRRQAWEASKQVGMEVASLALEVVRLRNEAARHLGFADFYVMSITLQEQDTRELERLFDDLSSSTRELFRHIKAEMDATLADRYGVSAGALMPWHYGDPFFQEAPRVLDYDLDAAYRNRDVVSLAGDFFRRIGLPADDILQHSDLYEKDGKEQHAYCMDIDRQGDIRILANVRNDERWMETLLHELGHAIYDKSIDPELPYLLRSAAHTLTTEAIAMFFERRSRSVEFARRLLALSETASTRHAEAAGRLLRYDRLVFSRWVQVMVRFERALYENPDRDLNRLWWDLVEQYQEVQRPRHERGADWASKIHIVTNPVYYHNYMLGEILASQLQHTLSRRLGTTDSGNGYGHSFVDRPEASAFLREHFLRHGARLHWRDLVLQATGEALSAGHFAAQFIDSSG